MTNLKEFNSIKPLTFVVFPALVPNEKYNSQNQRLALETAQIRKFMNKWEMVGTIIIESQQPANKHALVPTGL